MLHKRDNLRLYIDRKIGPCIDISCSEQYSLALHPCAPHTQIVPCFLLDFNLDNYNYKRNFQKRYFLQLNAGYLSQSSPRFLFQVRFCKNMQQEGWRKRTEHEPVREIMRPELPRLSGQKSKEDGVREIGSPGALMSYKV